MRISCVFPNICHKAECFIPGALLIVQVNLAVEYIKGLSSGHLATFQSLPAFRKLFLRILHYVLNLAKKIMSEARVLAIGLCSFFQSKDFIAITSAFGVSTHSKQCLSKPNVVARYLCGEIFGGREKQRLGFFEKL